MATGNEDYRNTFMGNGNLEEVSNAPRASNLQSITSCLDSTANVQTTIHHPDLSTSDAQLTIPHPDLFPPDAQPTLTQPDLSTSDTQLTLPHPDLSTSDAQLTLPHPDLSASDSQPTIPNPISYEFGSQPASPASIHENCSTISNKQVVWTLFKCMKCLVNFSTPWKAVKHLKLCHVMQHKNKQCGHCHRTIAQSDLKTHSTQHSLGGKFDVVDMTDDISSKLIFKCVDCEVCYDETRFRDSHTSNVCTIRAEECGECEICDLIMHYPALKFHNKFHKKFNLHSSYFIVVSVTLRMMQRRRKFTFYQCSDCSICYYSPPSARMFKTKPEYPETQ